MRRGTHNGKETNKRAVTQKYEKRASKRADEQTHELASKQTTWQASLQ